MEKRTFLAIILSIVIVIAWSVITSKFYPVENKGVINQNTPLTTSAPIIARPMVTQKISPSSLFKFSLAKQEVIFTESEAAIQEVQFQEYQNYKLSLQSALLWGDELKFGKARVSGSSVEFIYADQEKRIKKEFIFNPNYSIDLRIEIDNMSNLQLALNFPLILGDLKFEGKPAQQYQDVTVSSPEKIAHLNAHKETTIPEVKFLGLRDRYFCAIIEPTAGRYSAFIRKVNSNTFQVGLQPSDWIVLPGQTTERVFRIYLGPQDLKIVNSINPDWTAVIHYGTFGLISELLLQLLRIIYQMVHSWGWAIVILSIFIYFMLYPLTLKQMRSMKAMQALQPLIEELKRKHKDSPQRLNKEIMELYREHKVNPFGGCLPLVLQLPIFFALYQAIMRSIALKGAQFLWIKDLSEPDRLFMLPQNLPLSEINILPILMAIGMFVQQKISLKAASPGAAEQQKMMLILMPLLFGVIFYRMPAALVLYWFVNSTLMLISQIKAGYAK